MRRSQCVGTRRLNSSRRVHDEGSLDRVVHIISNRKDLVTSLGHLILDLPAEAESVARLLIVSLPKLTRLEVILKGATFDQSDLLDSIVELRSLRSLRLELPSALQYGDLADVTEFLADLQHLDVAVMASTSALSLRAPSLRSLTLRDPTTMDTALELLDSLTSLTRLGFIGQLSRSMPSILLKLIRTQALPLLSITLSSHADPLSTRLLRSLCRLRAVNFTLSE